MHTKQSPHFCSGHNADESMTAFKAVTQILADDRSAYNIGFLEIKEKIIVRLQAVIFWDIKCIISITGILAKLLIGTDNRNVS